MENEMERFLRVCADLESGKIRVAEKKDGEWIVNSWIKEVILSGFRLGKLLFTGFSPAFGLRLGCFFSTSSVRSLNCLF